MKNFTITLPVIIIAILFSLSATATASGMTLSGDTVRKETPIEKEVTGKDSVAAMLDNVTVYADRIRVKGSLTTIGIPGTAFEHAGSSYDMLANLPGLMLGMSGIEVLGLGQPVFEIDGRIIKDMTELKALRSEDVREVKIERSPGPAYEGNTRAVVSVITRKRAGDFLYLNVSNTLGIGRKVNESPDISFKAKLGKFATGIYYSFGHSASQFNETYFREIKHPSSLFSIDQSRIFSSNRNRHSLKWSGEWRINAKNRLAAFYSFDRLGSGITTSGDNDIRDGASEEVLKFDDRDRSKSDLHNATLLYDYVNGRTTLKVTQDLTFSGVKGDYRSREGKFTAEDVTEINTHSKKRYGIYSLRADFVTDRFFWGIYLGAGIRYSHISSKTDIRSDNPYLMDGKYSNRLSVGEDNAAAYLSFSRMFGRFSVRPGVRLQYVSRRSSDRMGDGTVSRIHGHDISVFPWLTVNYYASADMSLYLQYTRRLSQPNFSQMNSGIIYQDTLAYKNGNPSLRASCSESVTIGMNMKGIILTCSYGNTRNPIADVMAVREPGSNTLWEYSINLRRQESFSFGAGYNKRFSKLLLYAIGYMNLNRCRLPEPGLMPHSFSMSFNAQVNLSYTLDSHFSFFGNYTLQGRNRYLIAEQRSVQNFTLGANCSLLSGRLNISLQAADIFNQAHYNNITSRYRNVTWGTRGKNDMRRVTLTLSYTFLNKQIDIKGGRGNSTELNRIRE